MSVDKFGCFLIEKEYSRDITKGIEKFQSILNDYDGHLNVQRNRLKIPYPPFMKMILQQRFILMMK